jgi:uncharacterized protein
MMNKLLIKSIAIYQYFISPMLGNHCRFYPSCSHYAQQAIEKHGFVKGVLLSLKRLSCCQPFHEGGIDPVPEKLNLNPYKQ